MFVRSGFSDGQECLWTFPAGWHAKRHKKNLSAGPAFIWLKCLCFPDASAISPYKASHSTSTMYCVHTQACLGHATQMTLRQPTLRFFSKVPPMLNRGCYISLSSLLWCACVSTSSAAYCNICQCLNASRSLAAVQTLSDPAFSWCGLLMNWAKQIKPVPFFFFTWCACQITT